MKDPKYYGDAQIHLVNEHNADASCESVWKILNKQWGDISTWATAIESSEAIYYGSHSARGRSCTSDVGVLTDSITECNPSTHHMCYDVNGMPNSFKTFTNTWDVESVDDTHCKVYLTTDFRVDTREENFNLAEARMDINNKMCTLLDDLCDYACNTPS